ncbi:hypothetical protein [Chryseobacterium sp. CFS15]|uniref:hypothetical protein n=1 Tax=Chryseobacterium sp. CFS15 TaxID=2986946 RepID=UPI0028068ED4|nr:hypothetical protein [Chryseobacterium sp. CFS15]MDQ8144232.1 hypothetical protein [Chryseobacterium sp. CFS15]
MKVKCNSKKGNYLGEYKNLYTLYRQALVKPKLKYIQQFDVTGNAKYSLLKFREVLLTKSRLAHRMNFYIIHLRLYLIMHILNLQIIIRFSSWRMFVLELLASHYYTKLTIVFTPRNPATTVHELLHAVGLPHSWEKGNKNSDINGFIFEKFKTDNVMDYYKNRYSLWKWQWKKLQSNCNHHQYKP